MKKVCRFAFVAGLVFCVWRTAFAGRDLYSDTWVATDALGRQLAEYEQCGPVRKDKTVGIFYFLWLGRHGTRGPYDITRLLEANPDDPKWGPPGAFHHWGRSELGYYLSDSEYAITKHAFMLNDAGIDTLIFDATNAVPYTKVCLKLCEIYGRLRLQGHRTPQVCFLTHSHARQTIEKIYHDFYEKKLYDDLWFYWKGKPLILGAPKDLPEQIRDFFTIRDCWAWTHGKDTWQWLDHSENRFGWHESPDIPEEISVSVAEHPTSNIGRSYQKGSQPKQNNLALTGSEHLGLYFAEQWRRALKVDPQFVFVTGWNEWVAQRFINKGSQSFLGELRPEGSSFFVDAYSQEYSRDIEPMEGGHTDNYYFQLVSNVRRYKGVRKRPVATKDYPIRIDGLFDDWSDVTPEFRDTIGDTLHRDEPGWGNAARYANSTGRNDFETLKVACDKDNVYFYARTSQPITRHTDENWMLLFVDTDQDRETGWNGYDYLINSEAISSIGTNVRSLTDDGELRRPATVHYRYSGNQMEIAVGRSTIGLEQTPLVFDFHWADNIRSLDNIIEFAINGDSAPNRRFNYRFRKED
jgi:hypothetical protein